MEIRRDEDLFYTQPMALSLDAAEKIRLIYLGSSKKLELSAVHQKQKLFDVWILIGLNINTKIYIVLLGIIFLPTIWELNWN